MTAILKLDHLDLEKFTVFRDRSKLDLSSGINIFLGENGTGKTHLLKLLYCCLQACARSANGLPSTKDALERRIAEHLFEVFRPDALGRLVHRGRGVQKATIALRKQLVDGSLETLRFGFSSRSQSQVSLDGKPGEREVSTVFLPSREVLSFFPGFQAAWNRRELEFDRTYADLCGLLDGAPLKTGPRSEEIRRLVHSLEKTLGASVSNKNQRFYLRTPGAGSFEAHLVAEGLRKLATLMYLILNGTLSETSILFWDEPEANLNPRYIRVLVDTLLDLERAGTQIFLASHDYLLTQKLALEAERRIERGDGPNIRFFALTRPDSAQHAVTVESSPLLSELPNPILDEFARQYDEEIALLREEVSET